MGRGGDGLEASNGGGGKKKRGWVLMEAELVEIAASRYHGGDYTPIDKLFSPFWNWVASLMPSWLAPNLITFSGLMAVSLGSATILFHSSDLASPAPQWCYFVNAGTLFFYQTMDAIDGKQARRTNSANAVGQLMDHGCDSLVTLMCLICASASLRQGATWRVSSISLYPPLHNQKLSRLTGHSLLFLLLLLLLLLSRYSIQPWLVFFNGELAFFAAQWEEYHLGVGFFHYAPFILLYVRYPHIIFCGPGAKLVNERVVWRDRVTAAPDVIVSVNGHLWVRLMAPAHF
jgi:hypothetical protein